MSNTRENNQMIQINGRSREFLARDAFYGSNEQLADKIKTILSYEENGQTFPANGFSLASALEVARCDGRRGIAALRG